MRKRRFIHYSYILFPLVIVTTLIISFTAKNNFTADYANQIGLISSETRSKKEVREFVKSELIKPFELLRSENLGDDKGDCFEHRLIFNYNYEEEENMPFYKDQMIGARVVEVDCEQELYLYSVKIYFDKKEILVQTSIEDDWISAADFIEEYKQRITK